MITTDKKSGFTLVEILVAAFIFSIVIALISGVFVSVLQSQGRILATQIVLDNASYSIEYMSRALRMARTDEPGPPNCAAANKTYKIIGGGDRIDFMNYKEDCQGFYLDGTTLRVEQGGFSGDMTPDELRVTTLNFRVIGNGVNDSLQPAVTIFVTFEGALQGASNQPKLSIQTTVTKRNLDIRRH